MSIRIRLASLRFGRDEVLLGADKSLKLSELIPRANSITRVE